MERETNFFFYHKCSVYLSLMTWLFSVLVGWFTDNHSCQTSEADMSASFRLKCYATSDLLWLALA